jgi:hypothetical protein
VESHSQRQWGLHGGPPDASIVWRLTGFYNLPRRRLPDFADICWLDSRRFIPGATVAYRRQHL